MPAVRPQSYDNHVVIPRLHVAQLLALLVVVVLGAVGLTAANPATQVRWLGAALLIQAITSLTMVVKARFYALTLQDRLIRLEMQVRLEKVLPDDLKPCIPQLVLPQLIGLRFASDEELPELVRRVVDEKIGHSDPIKRLIRNWRPDYNRV